MCGRTIPYFIGEGDVPLSEREEPGNTVILGNRREKPQIYPEAIWKGFSMKVTWPIAHLKCIYTNICSMGNKQEEMDAIVLLENYDVISFKEMQWDESHNWNFMIEDYKIFRGELRMWPTMLRNIDRLQRAASEKQP